MTTAKIIYEKINEKPFSYGETIYLCVEAKGIPISPIPKEDFVFPDNSVLRITNKECKVLDYLTEYKQILQSKSQTYLIE